MKALNDELFEIDSELQYLHKRRCELIKERDLNQSNSTPLEIDCDICGDFHDADSVPLSCGTGDGE